jgi:lipopolysaccharide transport system ATP-binding protein
MGDVSRRGRTVLFVSHNLDAIRNLCGKAVVLQGGKLVFLGTADDAVDQYLSTGVSDSGEVTFAPSPDKPAFFRKVRVLNHSGETSALIDVRRGFSLEFSYEAPEPIKNLEVAFRVLMNDGRPVFTSLISEALPEMLEQTQQGVRTAIATIPGNFLYPGSYFISVALHEPAGRMFDRQDAAVKVSIEDTGTIFTKYHQDNHTIGPVIRPLAWTCAPPT